MYFKSLDYIWQIAKNKVKKCPCDLEVKVSGGQDVRVSLLSLLDTYRSMRSNLCSFLFCVSSTRLKHNKEVNERCSVELGQEHCTSRLLLGLPDISVLFIILLIPKNW